MDNKKLNFVTTLLIEQVRNGTSLTKEIVKSTFVCVDAFEEEAGKRHLLPLIHCPHCGERVKFIKADNSIETRCKCTASSGSTIEEAGENHFNEAIKKNA